MKNILRVIKKFIPEIIALLIFILLMIGYGIVTARLNSNSIYDGNYIGGNSTDAYINLDVKWIPSVEETPGVDKIEFNEYSDFKNYEKEEILEEEGWYWISYDAQVNGFDGYHELGFKNILVQDIWSGDLDELYVLTVEDGVGYLFKPNDFRKNSTYPIVCDICFSNNGVVFSVMEIEGEVGMTYLEKNGKLTAYNFQIAQACLIGAIAITGIVYIIYAFSKNKIIFIAVATGLMLISFGLSISEFRDNNVGEWRSVEDEDEVVLVPRHNKEFYVQLSGSLDDLLMDREASFEEYVNFEFDTDSRSFKEEYKRYDVIAGYTVYPFVFMLDLVLGVVLGIVGTIFKKEAPTEQANKVGYIWEYPFGEYSIVKVKYISEAFKGMEEYFIQNLQQDKVSFLSSSFSFDEYDLQNPLYGDNHGKIEIYNGAKIEKGHIITISDENTSIEYDLCFTSKNSYIRKKLGDMITVVYEIQMKEG